MGRFRIMGVRLQVHPGFPLLMAVIGGVLGMIFGDPALFALVTALSVGAHELGHAWVARRVGYQPIVDLTAIGGRTAWGAGVRPTPTQRFAVSAGGPAVSVVLGLVGLALWTAGPGVLGRVGSVVAGLNLGLAALTLTPIPPQDGARLVAAALDQVTDARGTRLAKVGAYGLCGVLVVAFLASPWPWMYSVPLVLGFAAAFTPDQSPLAVDLPVPEAIEHAEQAMAEGDLATAVAVLESFLATADDPIDRAHALELLGWAYLYAGRVGRARDATARMPSGHGPTDALEGAILCRSGQARRATGILRAAVRDHPSDYQALAYLGVALALSGKVEEAVRVVQGNPAIAAPEWVAVTVMEALHHGEQLEASVDLGTEAFGRTGDGMIAYNIACGLARLGRVEEARTWLERADAAGMDTAPGRARDPDLAVLREALA